MRAIASKAMHRPASVPAAYPTLLAAVGDVAHPEWRATAVGVYRLWRHAGFVVGAILSGVVADMFDLGIAIWAVHGVTAGGAIIAGVRMYETHLRGRKSRAVPVMTPSVRARSHIYKDVAGGGKG